MRIPLFYNIKTVHNNCNTAILLKRELRTPSYIDFWNFKKYLSKVFETFMNDYIWLAKRGKIYFISMARDNNKCYVKFVFWKVFKNLKLLTSPFPGIYPSTLTNVCFVEEDWVVKGKKWLRSNLNCNLVSEADP